MFANVVLIPTKEDPAQLTLKKCNFCKRIGHFSKCCLKKKLKSINDIVRTNKDSTESEDEEQFFIGSIEDDFTFSEDTKWCIDLDTASTNN